MDIYCQMICNSTLRLIEKSITEQLFIGEMFMRCFYVWFVSLSMSVPSLRSEDWEYRHE